MWGNMSSRRLLLLWQKPPSPGLAGSPAPVVVAFRSLCIWICFCVSTGWRRDPRIPKFVVTVSGDLLHLSGDPHGSMDPAATQARILWSAILYILTSM